MDDHKKEAIEVIDVILKFWYGKGVDDGEEKAYTMGYPTKYDAQLLYNRIAPPIRGELPEEARQEAIRAIAKEILAAWRTGWSHIPRVELHEALRAEALYDRLLPLIREDIGGWTTWVERASDAITERVLDRLLPLIRGEFPDEKFEASKEIEDCATHGEASMRGYITGKKPRHATGTAVSAGQEARSLKPLFEGQEPQEGDPFVHKTTCPALNGIGLCFCFGGPREGDNILEQEKPKGTCQTCGGMKKGYWSSGIGSKEAVFVPSEEGGVGCPDCTGEQPRDPHEGHVECCANCRYDGGQKCKRHAPIYSEGAGGHKFPQIINTCLQWCGDFEPRNRPKFNADGF